MASTSARRRSKRSLGSIQRSSTAWWQAYEAHATQTVSCTGHGSYSPSLRRRRVLIVCSEPSRSSFVTGSVTSIGCMVALKWLTRYYRKSDNHLTCGERLTLPWIDTETAVRESTPSSAATRTREPGGEENPRTSEIVVCTRFPFFIVRSILEDQE